MHTFHCIICAIFQKIAIITNVKKERQCYLLKLKNNNCQDMKRLPHSFYILKVKCTFICIYLYFMLQFWWNNIQYHFMHTCYKIYSYFEFQFFTYHISSVVHSATLKPSLLDFFSFFVLVFLICLIFICVKNVSNYFCI